MQSRMFLLSWKKHLQSTNKLLGWNNDVISVSSILCLHPKNASFCPTFNLSETSLQHHSSNLLCHNCRRLMFHCEMKILQCTMLSHSNQAMNTTHNLTEFLNDCTGNNPIYNHLPDIISRLSCNSELSQDTFRNVVEFLISTITKVHKSMETNHMV